MFKSMFKSSSRAVKGQFKSICPHRRGVLENMTREEATPELSNRRRSKSRLVRCTSCLCAPGTRPPGADGPQRHPPQPPGAPRQRARPSVSICSARISRVCRSRNVCVYSSVPLSTSQLHVRGRVSSRSLCYFESSFVLVSRPVCVVRERHTRRKSKGVCCHGLS